ncbi:MAG: iron-containing alcohol dehydrogenase family protein [Chloroflexota bacterium]
MLDLLIHDRTRFGAGAVRDLPSLVGEAGGSRAFVVTDPGVVRSGVVDRVVRRLAAAGLETTVFDGVEANPGTVSVERGSAALASFGLEKLVVVPVGGGSSIDTAKVISLHALNGGDVLALGYHSEHIGPGIPVVAVPTTAGTGAETNTYGVITDEVAGRKAYVGHPSVLPRATVLDPELTLGLPPDATAATGVDAMTHSLESLLSRNPNPFAEAMALHVIRTVAEWLPVAVADGSSIEARSQMLIASHLAGLGQASGTGVGAVHAIGHAVGTRGRLAHGTALATVLPEVLATYRDVRERELALVAVALGVAAPRDPPAEAGVAAIDALDDLLRRVGQRRTLRGLGIGPDLDRVIVADAVADAAIANSPRIPSAGEIAAILATVSGA